MCSRFLFSENSTNQSKETLPTDFVTVVTANGTKQMRWGFPRYDITGVVINARCETAHEKRIFSAALKFRRCIIQASGFFEYDKSTKPPKKYFISNENDETLNFAGLYDIFSEKGKEFEAFVILTCEANEIVSEIHDRMPVTLSEDQVHAWLNSEMEVSDFFIHNKISLKKEEAKTKKTKKECSEFEQITLF